MFYVEIPVGGSLGKTQQTEVQAKITLFTGSVPLFPKFMAKYRSLQNLLSSRADWGCVKILAAVRSQNTTLLMPGHRFVRANYRPFCFLSLH